MKNLIRLFLVLLIASVGIGLHTSCSEDSDCSIAGRAMINCTLYTKDVKDEIVNDTLDSLTVTHSEQILSLSTIKKRYIL